MGRYQTEAAYLKSVLLWLQGNWGEPDPPRFYPPKEGEQGSRYYSVRRNRRDVIFEQPAFLPARSASARPRGRMSLNHWYNPSEQFPSKAEMPATIWRNEGKSRLDSGNFPTHKFAFWN